MQRVFSGIQPSGNLTIGNYLGAIKTWVKMQKDYECIFCLVDQHTITVPQQPKELYHNTITGAAIYIASGINPQNAIIYPQSWLAAHTELAWILATMTPIGWLNRMTQFKDKAGNNKEKAGLGLYAYPVLMAADILLFHTNKVPVGDDQNQHIEITRDIAAYFNRRFGIEYFSLPQTLINEEAPRIMSLRDGTKKMSKSDISDLSRINILDEDDLINKKIRKAKTDNIANVYYNRQQRPEVANLITMYCALNSMSIANAEEYFKHHTTASFKKEIADCIIANLAPIREKANYLLQDKKYLIQIMQNGKEKASKIANKTMLEVKKILGFVS